MRILFSLLFIGVVTLSVPAQARMYQWVDAGSGNVRLSGEPPSWYRNGEHGPRVLVFEDGRLVDDTAIALPTEQQNAYREAAFLEVDLRREKDAVNKLERAALREARRREEAKRQLSADLQSQNKAEDKDAAKSETPRTATLPSSPEELDGSMVDQLKALISAWDRQNGASEKP